MAKLISGRVQRLNVGIVSYSENQTTLSVIGISSFSDVVLNGSVSTGSTIGVDGQYLKSTGVGVTWASFPTLRTESTFTATSGQDTFNVSYNVGFIDVYVNGVRLTDSEYTASNGTSVILIESCFGGETIDILSYNVTSTGGGGNNSESDTLDSVTSRGNITSNNISVGILTAAGNVYTDVIRRKTDNSTNTKISLDSDSLKLYAGNGVSPKVTVNGGVGINTNLNITGITTITGNLNAPGNYYIKLARTTNQTVPNGTDTLIGFSVISDSNNWYSGITTRTTPTVAGTYHVDVMLNWQAGSVTNNQTNIQIRKNGVTFALSQVGIHTFAYTQNACGIVTMNGTTDYIDFTAFTGNPTNQVVTGTADGAWTKMEIFKIN